MLLDSPPYLRYAERVFVARLTDVTFVPYDEDGAGEWRYAWIQQEFSPFEGEYVDAQPALLGDTAVNYATELRNAQVSVPRLVWLRLKGSVSQQQVYEFWDSVASAGSVHLGTGETWTVYDIWTVTGGSETLMEFDVGTVIGDSLYFASDDLTLSSSSYTALTITPTTSVVRVTSSGDVIIYGIVASSTATAGRQLTIVNNSVHEITLFHQSSFATAIYRIDIPGCEAGSSISLGPCEWITLWYDPGGPYWRTTTTSTTVKVDRPNQTFTLVTGENTLVLRKGDGDQEIEIIPDGDVPPGTITRVKRGRSKRRVTITNTKPRDPVQVAESPDPPDLTTGEWPIKTFDGTIKIPPKKYLDLTADSTTNTWDPRMPMVDIVWRPAGPAGLVDLPVLRNSIVPTLTGTVTWTGLKEVPEGTIVVITNPKSNSDDIILSNLDGSVDPGFQFDLTTGGNVTLSPGESMVVVNDGEKIVDVASSATVSGYTDEQAQDAVGTILVDTDTINFTYTDATPSIIADVKKQMSITSDSSGLKLSGDSTTPGVTKLYGTDGSGTKGWYAQPSATATRTEGTLAATGNALGNAALIVTDSVVVSGADGTKGVILPDAAGALVAVKNGDLTNSLNVYPHSSGATISTFGAGTADGLGATATKLYIRMSSTQWRTSTLA